MLIFLYFHVMHKLRRPMMTVNVGQVMIFVLEKTAISTKEREREDGRKGGKTRKTISESS